MAGYVQIAYLFREAPRLINIPRQYEPHLVAPFCLLWDKQNRWESALEVKLRRRGSGRRVTSPICSPTPPLTHPLPYPPTPLSSSPPIPSPPFPPSPSPRCIESHIAVSDQKQKHGGLRDVLVRFPQLLVHALILHLYLSPFSSPLSCC